MVDIEEVETKYLGKTIKITLMDGEPEYTGREGIVDHVDGIGQLHGTWGCLAINLDVDDVVIID